MTKTKILFALLLSLLFSTYESKAQTTDTKIPRIEVTGTSEILVDPDEIFVSIRLSDRTLNKEIITMEEQETELKKRLKELNISTDNLTIAQTNTEVLKIKRKSKTVVTTKQYMLKLKSSAEVRQTFELLDKMEISDANISSTNVSNRIQLMKQARIDAIKAAKLKAEYLLEAIGEKIDKPILVRESTPGFYINPNEISNGLYNVLSNSTSAETTETAAPVDEISIQKITILSSVYVEFSIKP
jgi:uncharacterized protein